LSDKIVKIGKDRKTGLKEYNLEQEGETFNRYNIMKKK